MARSRHRRRKGSSDWGASEVHHWAPPPPPSNQDVGPRDVLYDFSTWNQQARNVLMQDLRSEGVEYSWEGFQLRIPDSYEEVVDELIQADDPSIGEGPHQALEPGQLAPVTDRTRWIGGGFALQVVGAGVPAGYVISIAHRMSIGGHITSATVLLAWRSDSHTTTGLALLLSGALVFAVGSTLMARPFVLRRSTLLIAVPIAAVAGVLVLGLLALLVGALLEPGSDWFGGGFGGGGGGGSGRKRRPKQTA